MEYNYAFIKNKIVEDILVFNEKDSPVIQDIILAQGYDEAIYVETPTPHRYSTYENGVFENPSFEYLKSRGIIYKDAVFVEPIVVSE